MCVRDEQFDIIAVFCRSVTIELRNEDCWKPGQGVPGQVVAEAFAGRKSARKCGSGEAEASAEVFLDGVKVLDAETNVVSIGHLEPGREYAIRIGDDEKLFRTKEESVLLNVRKFGARGVRHTDSAEQIAQAAEGDRDVNEQASDGQIVKTQSVGEQVTDDTAAIQAAILACPKDGTVYIPAGKFRTGPLFLKSDMTFWLDDGAELLALTDRRRYPILPGMIRSTDEQEEYNFGTWEGNPLDMFASLITAIGCHNVDIIGGGTLNGQGKEGGWWENPKKKQGICTESQQDTAHGTAGRKDGTAPADHRGQMRVSDNSDEKAAWRPDTVFLNRCSNIRVQGIRVCNSPAWTVHPYYSDHLQFLNLTIENPYHSPNTDGWDPESCTDVLLLGTRISVGDDCIAIKSGKIYMAREHFRATHGIEIRNCLLEKGHGSVTIGSEIAGGVNDVHVSKCIFHETDRGIRIKSRRGRGDTSVLDGLVFENIQMDHVHMPVTVNMFYFCDPDGHSRYVQAKEALPVDERTPKIGTIVIRDVRCTGVHASVIAAFGLPEQPIARIAVSNLDAAFAGKEERVPEQAVMADGIPAMDGRSVVACNVGAVQLSDVTFRGAEDQEPEFTGVGEVIKENVRYLPVGFSAKVCLQ